MKKAALPLNYAFLIFVSVIAVFVIVGMLSKWSLSSNKFMCKLSGDCDEQILLDKQTITVQSSGDNTRFVNEIVKHAKICYERSKGNENAGELCYTVKCETCSASNNDISSVLTGSDWDTKIDYSEFSSSNKAIIEFDYGDIIVRIR
ncbi:hypothetical protein GF327_02180 [Candidatus Woesearchaeota archaeon]|nr:hypothetical protein [Candidatus Woesearchaeota archaeon]